MPPRSPRHLALGQQIRSARAELGLSQDKAAEWCDLDRSYYGSIERGERNITIGTLWLISDALGIKASELLLRVE